MIMAWECLRRLQWTTRILLSRKYEQFWTEPFCPPCGPRPMIPTDFHVCYLKPGKAKQLRCICNDLCFFWTGKVHQCFNAWSPDALSTNRDRQEITVTPLECAEPTFTTGTPSPWQERGMPSSNQATHTIFKTLTQSPWTIYDMATEIIYALDLHNFGQYTLIPLTTSSTKTYSIYFRNKRVCESF